MNGFVEAVLLFILQYFGDRAWEVVEREAKLRARINSKKKSFADAMAEHRKALEEIEKGVMGDEEKTDRLVRTARTLIRR